MSVIQWNIRGYHSRYSDLVGILDTYKPTCFVIQESMLGARIPIPPRDYSMETFSPTGQAIPGDGLVTLIHRSSAYTKLHINTDLQAMAIRVQLNKLYTICNIYINPNQHVTPQQIVHIIDQLPQPYLLLGDINGKHPLWGNTHSDRIGNIFENIISNNDVYLLNNGQATHFHIQTATSSAIDISLCSPEISLDLNWSVLDDTYGSDHFPLMIRESEPAEVIREQRYVMKKADWKLYKQCTETGLTADSPTIDEDVKNFNDLVTRACNLSIPRATGPGRRRPNPWWNDECTLANMERKRALRKYQRTKCIADRITLRRTTARATYVKNQARKNSWNDYISTLTVDTPMTKIWNRIGKMRGKYPVHHPPCLTINNNTISEQADVANALGAHYASISSDNSYSERFRRIKAQHESRALNCETNVRHPYNDPITMTELLGTIRQTKKSAPGPDNISYDMIRNLHITAHHFLLSIFNRVWLDSVYPSLWRDATVLSFLKPGKPSSDASSYRPIALTSCTGKLMEKIINMRLMKYLETNNCISPVQFGFRKMHSTIDAVTRLHTDVSDALAKREQAVCVLFDMQKAYDTAWRRGILEMLHSWGLRGVMLKYITNFLTNRKFKTKIGSNYSRHFQQNEGVPQGSVLSCTLFIVAINGVIDVIPPGIKSSLYVDDLVIYGASSRIVALERRIQVAVNNILEWTLTHGFTLSTTKTVAIHFHRKKRLQPEPTIYMSQRPIIFRDNARFLGMILDQRMSWKPHIAQLRTQCLTRLNLLKTLSRKTWGGDRTTMLRLYRAYIRPKLDYGCTVYGSARVNILAMLDPVHNLAIRLSTRAFRSSPVQSLYAESGEPPLHTRRQQLSLQYYVRTKQLPQSPAYNSVHHPVDNGCRLSFRDRMLTLTRDLGLDQFDVSPNFVTDDPVWRVRHDLVCEGVKSPSKNNIQANHLKALFIDHQRTCHSNEYHIYTDGSKNNENVGSAAVSADARILRRLCGTSSIFTAELRALHDALVIASNSAALKITIFSDSKSVLQALQIHNNNHPIVSEIVHWLLLLSDRNKDISFCWVPSHVDIDGNETADACAREAANSDALPIMRAIPCKDYYPLIRKVMMDRWQDQWNEVGVNKLRTIKESVLTWPSSQQKSIKDSTILTRLRIGHTALTHGFLMEQGNAVYCDDCLVPLTVLHVLTECPSTEDTRRRFYPALSNHAPVDRLKGMLAEVRGEMYNIGTLLLYLRHLNIYSKI